MSRDLSVTYQWFAIFVVLVAVAIFVAPLFHEKATDPFIFSYEKSCLSWKGERKKSDSSSFSRNSDLLVSGVSDGRIHLEDRRCVGVGTGLKFPP